VTGDGVQESDESDIVPPTIPTSFLHQVVQHSRDDGEGEVVKLSAKQDQEATGDGDAGIESR